MPSIYSSITKHIKLLENDIFGEGSNESHSVSKSHVSSIAPHVHYTKKANAFINDVYKFINDNDDNTNQNKYDAVKESVHKKKFDIDTASGDEIIFYLLGIINSERFCDGMLLDKYNNGTIEKCLKRLKWLDNKNTGIYNQRMSKTSLRGE